jgi:hypothetical protein
MDPGSWCLLVGNDRAFVFVSSLSLALFLSAFLSGLQEMIIYGRLVGLIGFLYDTYGLMTSDESPSVIDRSLYHILFSWLDLDRSRRLSSFRIYFCVHASRDSTGGKRINQPRGISGISGISIPVHLVEPWQIIEGANGDGSWMCLGRDPRLERASAEHKQESRRALMLRLTRPIIAPV